MQEAKKRAAGIMQASELWELEDWLGESRREIDRIFDFRYSVLAEVFAALLIQGFIDKDDLTGLAADKIDAIQGLVRRSAEYRNMRKREAGTESG